MELQVLAELERLERYLDAQGWRVPHAWEDLEVKEGEAGARGAFHRAVAEEFETMWSDLLDAREALRLDEKAWRASLAAARLKGERPSGETGASGKALLEQGERLIAGFVELERRLVHGRASVEFVVGFQRNDLVDAVFKARGRFGITGMEYYGRPPPPRDLSEGSGDAARVYREMVEEHEAVLQVAAHGRVFEAAGAEGRRLAQGWAVLKRHAETRRLQEYDIEAWVRGSSAQETEVTVERLLSVLVEERGSERFERLRRCRGRIERQLNDVVEVERSIARKGPIARTLSFRRRAELRKRRLTLEARAVRVEGLRQRLYEQCRSEVERGEPLLRACRWECLLEQKVTEADRIRQSRWQDVGLGLSKGDRGRGAERASVPKSMERGRVEARPDPGGGWKTRREAKKAKREQQGKTRREFLERSAALGAKAKARGVPGRGDEDR